MHANIVSALLLEHCACSHCDAAHAHVWSRKDKASELSIQTQSKRYNIGNIYFDLAKTQHTHSTISCIHLVIWMLLCLFLSLGFHLQLCIPDVCTSGFSRRYVHNIDRGHICFAQCCLDRKVHSSCREWIAVSYTYKQVLKARLFPIFKVSYYVCNHMSLGTVWE